ncbi:UbiD family decarboxylase [Chloroflexota bacterium]
MAYKDLREWIAKIEEAGALKRITAEIDWDLELSGVARRVESQEGPALLFENIKGHKNTLCSQLFTGSLASQERIAMAFGLPMETDWRGIVEFIKERLGQLIDPIKVASGPVKQNIIKSDAVNLYEFPAPKYNKLDGGRYINTRGCVVTMDPDTGIMNVGMYRGMIGDDKYSIPVLLVPVQHWGRHFSKYKERGEEMPVAIAYGWDPALEFLASTPVTHHDYSEYELVGSLRGEPVELVKCETSDLYVPASAEIIVEGWISPDPKTFRMEGPFGEFPGYYAGVRHNRPTIRVECITYRDNPIFRGGLCGNGPDGLIEQNYWYPPCAAALIWRALEQAGVPNILGVWGDRIAYLANLRVQINKTHRGHAKHVAAIIFGTSNIAIDTGKNIIVVDKDIDVFDDEAVAWARAWRTNADMGAIQLFPGTIGTPLDPSVPLPQRDELKYGGGRWTRVLTDATVNWDLEPEEQYGGERQPPMCTDISPEIAELINRRWHEYGF